MNLYPFIQGSLEWRFSELFPLMYRYRINTNILDLTFFVCRILIISYKMLIITGITNEKTNELTIYGILCRNVTLFYRQEPAFLFQVWEKLNAWRSINLDFSSSCFIANDSHVKNVWLHVVVFSELDILYFWDNVHLFKYYLVKGPQNCFNYLNYSNQTCTQVSKFSFGLDK